MIGNRLVAACLTVLTLSRSGHAETNEITSEAVVNPDHDRLASAVNDFGYKLSLEMMKQSPNNNVVISPAGITGLLAMTLLGSVGKTYDELADALGFSQDISKNRHHHEQLGNLLKSLNDDSFSTTMYADTIIADAATRLREDYRMYLRRVYHGEAMSTDFKDPNATTVINDWVKEHTLGKIEDFLKEPLSAKTKVVLLSALYFGGQWAQPFVPDHTRKIQRKSVLPATNTRFLPCYIDSSLTFNPDKASSTMAVLLVRMPFSTINGDIMVDLMLNFGWFNYSFSISQGAQMLAFPYKDNTTTMYVLMPHKKNITELLQSLNYTAIDDLINQMRESECVVRFPKMELKSRTNLKETLKGLGVKSVFDPAEANFALMVDVNKVINNSEEELIARINESLEESEWKELVNRLPNPGVHVDSVLHDVKITIDEFGTEAVAASSGFLARTARLFYVQSPFYMFIRNERTKLVTFSAVIFDPTQ